MKKSITVYLAKQSLLLYLICWSAHRPSIRRLMLAEAGLILSANEDKTEQFSALLEQVECLRTLLLMQCGVLRHA